MKLSPKKSQKVVDKREGDMKTPTITSTLKISRELFDAIAPKLNLITVATGKLVSDQDIIKLAIKKLDGYGVHLKCYNRNSALLNNSFVNLIQPSGYDFSITSLSSLYKEFLKVLSDSDQEPEEALKRKLEFITSKSSEYKIPLFVYENLGNKNKASYNSFLRMLKKEGELKWLPYFQFIYMKAFEGVENPNLRMFGTGDNDEPDEDKKKEEYNSKADKFVWEFINSSGRVDAATGSAYNAGTTIDYGGYATGSRGYTTNFRFASDPSQPTEREITQEENPATEEEPLEMNEVALDVNTLLNIFNGTVTYPENALSDRAFVERACELLNDNPNIRDQFAGNTNSIRVENFSMNLFLSEELSKYVIILDHRDNEFAVISREFVTWIDDEDNDNPEMDYFDVDDRMTIADLIMEPLDMDNIANGSAVSGNSFENESLEYREAWLRGGLTLLREAGDALRDSLSSVDDEPLF